MADDINIRSARFLLARTIGTCRNCREPTSMFALVVPPGHMALELDDAADDDATAVDSWRIASGSAFLFFVEFVGTKARARVNHFAGSYKLCAARGRMRPQWANHCDQCGAVQDDQDLFCEPGGAFLPVSAAFAGLIQLIPIDEPLEAIAGGYSHEPPFLDLMR